MTRDGLAALAHCRALLCIDTSNPGSTEESAAQYVAGVLAHAGSHMEIVEPEPGRCSVVARIAGRESSLPALLVHGHLDTVPADSDGWTYDPFSATEADGCIWGRGALDMKANVAAMLAVQEALVRDGIQPHRDVVFAYLADEERGGRLGSAWIVERRPELLAGVEHAIGELGGFSVTLTDGRRLFPVQCAERGMAWLRITVIGTAGHAAFTIGTNPVVRLGRLVTEIAELEFPHHAPAAHRELVATCESLLGNVGGPVAHHLGAFASILHNGGSTTVVPTQVCGSSAPNVIAEKAQVIVDCRFPHGWGNEVVEAVTGLLSPGEELDIIELTPGAETPAHGPLWEAIGSAIRATEPEAIVVPFALPAGTDAQRFARLGISGYGFSPLPMPPGFDHLALLHAPDERVPISAVVSGTTMLRSLLLRY